MMKKITGWIIYPATKCSMDTASYDWIISEAAKNDIELKVLFEEEIIILMDQDLGIIYRKKLLACPDFAIVRSYNFVLMNHITCMGIKLFNTTNAMRLSLNKALTHQQLILNKIPTVKTLFNCKDYNISKELLKEPFICKYSDGNRGKEVFMIDNHQQFNDILSRYDSIISQEFIRESSGKDLRIWVIGKKVVGGVMRYNENSFKSNFSLGGKAKAIEITAEIADIAIKSTEAVGLDFAGVDLLITSKGYLVCEVNGNAAFRTLSTVSDNNTIPHELFKFIFDRLSI